MYDVFKRDVRSMITGNKVSICTVLTSQSFLPIVLSSKVHDMPTFTENGILVAFCAILVINIGKMCWFVGVNILKWNNHSSYVRTKQ